MATASAELLAKPNEWQRLGAEFVGTFLLTFVAAGADIVQYITGGAIGHAARYVAPALIVMAMIWALCGISGAHINPAVTFMFWLRRSFPLVRVPGYILAQLLAAIAAAFALKALFGAAIAHGVTKPTLGFSSLDAFIIETLLTFMLAYTILATAQEEAVVGKNSALAIAGIIALGGLAFGPVSGASMNPARSIGPMIAAGDFGFLWIYIAGPLLGAGIAAGVTWLLYGDANESMRKAAHGKHQ